jgi:hypothetical protein
MPLWAVRYRITAAPLAMYHCHCGQCRRASGASFATNLLVQSEHFEVARCDDLPRKSGGLGDA